MPSRRIAFTPTTGFGSLTNNYVYEFIRIDPKGFFTKSPEEDYHVIIREKAAEGWRLVTVVTPPSKPYGEIGYYELIFERPESR